MIKEDYHSKFVRLAEDRTNRFKNVMLSISNLSDSRYDYTEEEVKWYFDELNDRVKKIKDEFFHPKNRNGKLVINPVERCPIQREIILAENEKNMNEKFHDLMVGRMGRVVIILNLLINLTNRSHYRFYTSEIKQIFSYINDVEGITLSHFVGIGDFSFKSYDHDEQEERRNVR